MKTTLITSTKDPCWKTKKGWEIQIPDATGSQETQHQDIGDGYKIQW